MQLYDFTVPELNKFRELCNFTPDEYEVVPSYKQYVIAKRRRQLNEISEDLVLDTLSRLGKELKDFVKSLYTATASENERILLSKIIADLKNVT